MPLLYPPRVTGHYTDIRNPFRVLIHSVRAAGRRSLKDPGNKQPPTAHFSHSGILLLKLGTRVVLSTAFCHVREKRKKKKKADDEICFY